MIYGKINHEIWRYRSSDIIWNLEVNSLPISILYLIRVQICIQLMSSRTSILRSKTCISTLYSFTWSVGEIKGWWLEFIRVHSAWRNLSWKDKGPLPQLSPELLGSFGRLWVSCPRNISSDDQWLPHIVQSNKASRKRMSWVVLTTLSEFSKSCQVHRLA